MNIKSDNANNVFEKMDEHLRGLRQKTNTNPEARALWLTITHDITGSPIGIAEILDPMQTTHLVLVEYNRTTQTVSSRIFKHQP